jgi:hypothetical protein
MAVFIRLLMVYFYWRGARTPNPKLFNGGAVGRQETPAAPTVNNFVAASAAGRFKWL